MREQMANLLGKLWWAQFDTRRKLRHWIANHNEQVRRKKAAQVLVGKYAEALKHILWVKDCGIDGEDEHGVYRNWPEEERDLMYKIAIEALEPLYKHEP